MNATIKNKNRQGFTIIELLVVVTIAVFILSMVSISFRDAKARGRDARREEDLKQIQNALNIYQINRRQFPVCPLTVLDGSSDCLAQALLGDNVTNVLSIDPLHGGTGTCSAGGSYVYCYESDGSDYILRYNLETDTIIGKSAGWHEVKS
ncbi:MAG: type II secretion system protein [Patescibacteria group bacterium]